MRVLLVKPNSESDSIIPPLGLGYLATRLRDRHEVRILNCLAANLDRAAMVERVRRFNPDVVGIQVFSSDRVVVRSYLRALGCLESRPVLVAGGPHPSSLPGEVLDEFAPELDYAFAGEAEFPFAKFIDVLAGGRPGEAALAAIPGLIRRDPVGGSVLVNSSRFRENIEEYGEPSWDLLKPEHYPHAPYAAFVRKLPVAPLVASRGCPCRCTFCAAGSLSGFRIRYRSPEHIVAEIERLKTDHGVREIQFADDNLTANPSLVASMCEQMIRQRTDLPWSCPNGVRIDTLDRDLLRLMRRAGCYSLAVGIETGSERLLQMVRKGTSLQQIRSKVGMIRQAGMKTVGYFIMGLPTETARERKMTADLALELPLDLANFMLYCPLPGTPLYDLVKGTDRFVDAESYNFSSAIHVPEGATERSLRQDQRKAFLRFYTRPHQIGILVSSFRSVGHLTYIGQRIARWLFNISLPIPRGKSTDLQNLE